MAALLARGMTNVEIGEELVVVVKTVEKHVLNLKLKLAPKNRAQIAAWAVANGLATPGSG